MHLLSWLPPGQRREFSFSCSVDKHVVPSVTGPLSARRNCVFSPPPKKSVTFQHYRPSGYRVEFFRLQLESAQLAECHELHAVAK